MNSSLFRFAVRAVFALGLTFSAVAARASFTARELAQGYSDTTIIAKPRAELASSVEASELAEGLTIRHTFPRIGNLRVLQVRSGERAAQTIARLRRTGRYEYVEPDRIIHAQLTANDPSYSQQWSLAKIGAPTAWNTATNALGVVVAVVDSGIYLSHEDMLDNLWPSKGISAVSGNGTTTDSNPNDSEVGHGTHVAGIIGARGNNGKGVSGVAWQVQLMALRFLHGSDGTGVTSDAIHCINYAITNGAAIINASYGSDTYSQGEFDAMNSARTAGIIVVAAAGNDGFSTDSSNDYPAGLPLDNIVSVAATDENDDLASFSNYGAGSVDLGAPGVNIVSTWNSNSSSYATASGTSMAAPHVSGALALLRSQFPTDSYRQLINRLLRSVTKIGGLSGKVQTGGRLNIGAAITATSNLPFNDSFASRAILTGSNVRVRSNNVGATPEASEPAHAGFTANTSLWWSWTAPSTTQVIFETAGSSYDTLLEVYTGSVLSSLSSVASNDNISGSVTTSRLTLNVTAGTTYQIAVDGKNGASGFTLLHIGEIPPNDNFANAIAVSGSSVSVSASLLNASSESSEKNPTGGAGNSIWYKWTAPSSGHYVLSAFGTQIDTTAAVYTGSWPLTTVASNNDSTSTNTDALVPFDATGGVTYYFQIDHDGNDGTPGGDFVMTLTDAAWEYPTDDEVTSSPAVASDGSVYFGVGSSKHNDTKIYALTSSGTKKWSISTGNNGIIGAAPVIGPDGTVYIGSDNKTFYALNGSTGGLKWSYTAGTAISSTAALAGDGTVYLRDDTTLYALTNGTQKWSFPLSGSTTGTYCSPVIGSDGTVYVGTNGGKFYAVNSSGTQKWVYTADGDIYTSAAIAADGTIYFATLNGTVYALTDNGGSATKKWSWTTAGNNSITSSIALGADGSLYFASYDHKLYALTSGGAQKWAFTLGDEVRASSPAVAADGTVYVGCYDGKMYAVNSNGELQRFFATAKEIRSSPAISGTRLYFGSADGKLYAIDIGQSAAGTPWPMFHANALRTGVASSGSVSISSQPQSRTVLAGSSVTLSVSATGAGTLTYQWYKDGAAIAGATSSSFTVNNVSTSDSGSYTVVVTSGASSVTSSAATLTALASGSGGSTLANISTRAYCDTGDNITIGGFVIQGTTPKRMLLRVLGPSANVTGSMADPTMEIYRGSTKIFTNDEWTENGNSSEINSLAAQLGAPAINDNNSSAMILSLNPGAYTVQARGKNNSKGIVLMEAFDADVGVGSKAVNISTRAYCGTGDNVAIGGFVISGTTSKQVLMRAIGGKTLAAQGVNEALVLADPVLELHHGAPVINSNDNWTTNTNVSDITTTSARIGAAPIAGTDTTSSVLLTVLNPGAYTFVVSGKSNSTGIVLLEVYDAD